MDTITHGIVGALTGKALFAGRDIPTGFVDGNRSAARSSPTARAAIVACTLGSIFPDIDIFAGPLLHNPLAIMEWHRNITHALVMIPLWAPLLAAASVPLARWLRWQRPSFIALAGIYAAGLATHIFLDLVTSFGTMVWSPLQYSRVAWDWIFILDLTLTAFALVPQLAAWCYRSPEKFAIRAACAWGGLTAAAFGGFTLASTAGYPFPLWVVGVVGAVFAIVLFAPAIRGAGFQWRRANWCRAGFGLVCAYLMCAAVMHREALANVDHFVSENHLLAQHRAAVPLPPTLTHWAGEIATSEGVWRTTFYLPGGAIERTQLYASAPPDPHIEEAKKLRDVQVYLWFARFPIWQVLQRDGQIVVDISDGRFFREDGSGTIVTAQQSKSLVRIRPNSAGFTFEVVFDAAGKVVSHGFKSPRQ